MNILVLRLLLRKVILSLAVLLALLFISPWMYPALGLAAAIGMMPILYPKFLARGQRPSQYWAVFCLSLVTWPDSLLTQTLRARRSKV